MSRGTDYSGVKCGLLTAVKPTADRDRRHVVWLCKCRCGTEILVAPALRFDARFHRPSCGCQGKAASAFGKPEPRQVHWRSDDGGAYCKVFMGRKDAPTTADVNEVTCRQCVSNARARRAWLFNPRRTATTTATHNSD